jgi:hypothetical protein
MRTQFGDMIITDDNKTIASETLQKEINDNMVDGKKAQFSITDENIFAKKLDK